MNAAEAGLSRSDLLIFCLDRRIFAFPVRAVLRILPMLAITALPQANGLVRGVINVHGELIPVINLHRHLGLAEPGLQLHTPLLLLQSCVRPIGVIADRVIDILNLSPEEITAAGQLLPGELSAETALSGLVVTSYGTVLILDVDRLFSPAQSQLLAGWLEATQYENQSETQAAL